MSLKNRLGDDALASVFLSRCLDKSEEGEGCAMAGRSIACRQLVVRE